MKFIVIAKDSCTISSRFFLPPCLVLGEKHVNNSLIVISVSHRELKAAGYGLLEQLYSLKMQGSQSSLVTSSSFILLALLRGSTPLMAYFAVSHLASSGLVVAWKSGISLVFFTIMLVTFYFTDGELKMQFMVNLKSKRTYWKLLLVGLFQAAAPYLLVVYSLRILPPTLLGVFMTATPWFTLILERMPCIKVTEKCTESCA